MGELDQQYGRVSEVEEVQFFFTNIKGVIKKNLLSGVINIYFFGEPKKLGGGGVKK